MNKIKERTSNRIKRKKDEDYFVQSSCFWYYVYVLPLSLSSLVVAMLLFSDMKSIILKKVAAVGTLHAKELMNFCAAA